MGKDYKDYGFDDDYAEYDVDDFDNRRVGQPQPKSEVKYTEKKAVREVH